MEQPAERPVAGDDGLSLAERTQALLEAHLKMDNERLVERWSGALAEAGGVYVALGEHTRTAIARATVGALREALKTGTLSTVNARRFVDPPYYRDQPLEEFLLAGMLVDRVVRDYLHEVADERSVAQAAVARVDPIMASGILSVIRLRQERAAHSRLITEVGRTLARGGHTRGAFTTVAERLSSELGVDLVLIAAVDPHEVTLFAASHPVERYEIPPNASVPREDLGFMVDVEADQHHDGPIEATGSGPERALAAAGFRAASVRALFAQGTPVGAIFWIRREDGPLERRVEEASSALAPLLAGYIGLARQIAALERANAAIDELFDESPNMMCALDRLGRILRTNARFRVAIGVPGDVVGMPLSWLVHPTWMDRYSDLWGRICSQEGVDQERVDLITADSERLPLSVEAHWLRDDVHPARVCMVAMTNVSKHVARHDEDRQRIDDLIAFSHHIAHDLKAPLRTIAGFAGLLLEELPPDSPELVLDAADRIERAARRGADLIGGLLQFARCGSVEGNARLVPLEVLIEAVQEQLAGEIAASGARLEVTSQAPVFLGDATALTTLLANLVGNALHYTGGSIPEITIISEPAAPGWANLVVADRGIGISPEMHERIFDLFERGVTEPAGTGVGLAIVRRIAQAHGGDVRVTSELGRGSRFIVQLPTP